MECVLCHHQQQITVAMCNIFPFVRSELVREIQRLSFIVWCAVEICELKVVN